MGEFKSGFVHVLGPANVGKSTYINATVGAKVTVTSDKPQTTRNRIRCISTTENEQVVFLDTPGIHRPVNKLGKYLMKEARRALKGSDVLLYMVEPRGKISKYDQAMLDKLKGLEAPRILLLNKIDVYGKEDIARTLEVYSSEEAFDEYIPISALEGTNIDLAHRKLVERLPEGPLLFPEGIDTDSPLEFIVAEYVREKVYRLTHEEVPYSVAVKTTSVEENPEQELMEIYAKIYVARESQKGILIGKRGSMIKKIGRKARKDLERRLGVQVYLDLTVSVNKNWNRDQDKIESLYN